MRDDASKTFTSMDLPTWMALKKGDVICGPSMTPTTVARGFSIRDNSILVKQFGKTNQRRDRNSWMLVSKAAK